MLHKYEKPVHVYSGTSKNFFRLFLIMPSSNEEKTCLAKISGHLDQNPGSAWHLILLHKALIHYISQDAVDTWVLIAMEDILAKQVFWSLWKGMMR